MCSVGRRCGGQSKPERGALEVGGPHRAMAVHASIGDTFLVRDEGRPREYTAYLGEEGVDFSRGGGAL